MSVHIRWSARVSRKCKHPGCEAEVPHRPKHSGYCAKKHGAHWNESEFNWGRPPCECGGDLLKSKSNPHPGHATWCKVWEWEKE